MLGHERTELVYADAVLAGARPAHRDRAHAHFLGKALGFFALGGVVRIEQHDKVKVAVADMSDDRRRQSRYLDIRAGCKHEIGRASCRERVEMWGGAGRSRTV